MDKRRILSLLVILTVFLGGFVLGSQFGAVYAAPSCQVDRDQLFLPFWETWDLIQNTYVESVDNVALMEGALSGLVDALGDPYSYYMDPETFAMVNNDLEGEFEGIGATVRRNQETGALVIIDTLPESPAREAGVLPGDAIIEVDGVDITQMTQTEVVALIRGPAGTTVQLGIVRAGESEPVALWVTRDRILVDNVTAEVLDGGLLYVQLRRFGMDTGYMLQEVLIEYDAENRSGLILDFRDNPGGFLSTAIEVASEFLAEGVILREQFRDNARVYEALGGPAAPTVPMVILVDESSASASELVAAALQDLGRATIIGNQTFGKGSVQTWRTLSNLGGVRITTALWYTPNDRQLNGVGLTPDIEIPSNDASPGEDLPLSTAIEFLLAETVTSP